MANFINVAFRLLLTFNATSLLFMIYAVQNEILLTNIIPGLSNFKELEILKYFGNIRCFNKIFSYLAYLIVPIILTFLSILLSSILGKDNFTEGEIISIEYANNSFLPSYLGYFFVALSVSNHSAFIVVYGLLFIFTFFSQALYFNPLFLLFNYNFYNVKTKSGLSIFLISSVEYTNPSSIEIPKVNRINNYTFIENKK